MLLTCREWYGGDDERRFWRRGFLVTLFMSNRAFRLFREGPTLVDVLLPLAFL